MEIAVLGRRLTAAFGKRATLRGNLVRGGFGSIGIKLLGAFLSLLLAVLLARMLGPINYGIYAYFLAWTSILAIPVQFGLPTLVVRETAKAQASGDVGRMRSLWKWAERAVASLSMLLVCGVGIGAWLFREDLSRVQLVTLGFGLMLVPIVALGNLRAASLSGLRHVLRGQLPEFVLRPGIFSLCLLALAATQRFDVLTPSLAMGLQAATAAAVLVMTTIMLRRLSPPSTGLPVIEEGLAREWRHAVLPLAMLAGATAAIQYADILMLGMMRPAADVGTYRVVLSASSVVAFGLGAVNLAIAPYMAQFYAQKDRDKLQRLVTASARVSFLMALPVVIGILLYSKEFIGVVFGKVYAGGAPPFAILVLGQLFNVAAGSSAILLNMTGHEKDTLTGIVVGAITNIALNLLLIPSYGITGAAISASAAMIVWNLLLWRTARMRVNVDSSIFSFATAEPSQTTSWR